MNARKFMESVVALGQEKDSAFAVKTSQGVIFHIGGMDILAMVRLLDLSEWLGGEVTVGQASRVLDRMKFWFNLLWFVWAKEGDIEGLEWDGIGEEREEEESP